MDNFISVTKFGVDVREGECTVPSSNSNEIRHH